MDYYCKRFGFGKPDIQFSPSSSRGANHDAVMTVGGRKIGMGSGQSKKEAQIRCYLDVTQYLESSDPPLWKTFSVARPPGLNISGKMGPHVVMTMSDDLVDDIRDLCKNIKSSTLYARSTHHAVLKSIDPTTADSSGAVFIPTEDALKAKSNRLLEQLEKYDVDPRVAKLRDQRASLPVAAKSSELLAKIETNEATICMAATGSGKTTQIPQMILDDYIRRGEGAKCNIFCTQPRRIAAISVAQRVAQERGQSLGENVGYQVRFDTKAPQPNGSITFCTNGIFLKRMQSALGKTDAASVAWLDSLTHILVDEVHERDIDVDLLLVVLKRLVADRRKSGKPIRIVLMSATIDPTLFQNYFADARGRPAAIADVPGRSYPVKRHLLDDFLPDLRETAGARGAWVFSDKDVVSFLEQEMAPVQYNAYGASSGRQVAEREAKMPHALVALTIAHVASISDDGHILCFLDGLDSIRKVHEMIMRSSFGFNFNGPDVSVHILHSSIPIAEQQVVFEPTAPGQRRIILATNIAETSVTIPNVVYVVDVGRVKESRYDTTKKIKSLVSAWVGQSNINQRSGRAGRHREGEYYGVISKKRMASLDQYALVEMKRSDLSSVVMHIKVGGGNGASIRSVPSLTPVSSGPQLW